MREILFRGKHKNGFWCYGNLNINSQGVTIITPDETALGKYGAVIPETVGQYTGLTDKNGKKIFEGDILKCCDDKIETEFMAIVEFGNPNGTYSWGWQLKPINVDKNVINPDILLWIEMEETGAICEVIGNIHDNPELLESED